MKELTIPVDGVQVTAVYLPHEEYAMRDLIAAAERAGTPRAAVEREVEFLHLLKAEFEAVLLP